MTSGFSFNQDFDSDDDEVAQTITAGRDACIFVIDCSASMFEEFEEDEETTCLYVKCMTVLERFLLNKIISNNKDLLAVVLYNTEKSPEPEGHFKMESCPVVPKGCAVMIPMKQIEAEIIQFVKNMESSDDFMDFDNKYGHSKDAKISDILWLCSSIFTSCDKQIHVPTIMWFSDDDSPHQDGSGDQRQALQKAKDLQQLNIELQFYPMKIDFDGDLFYKELLCQLLGQDLDDFSFPTPQLKEKLLLQRMFRRGCNKRAMSYLTVEFSEKAKFGIGIYSFTRKAKIPTPVMLSRATNQPIVSKRSYKYGTIQEDEGGPVENVSNLEAELDFKDKLEPNIAVKYQQCGGEKIRFTPLEAYGIKQVMDPKIKVLGFKPSNILSDRNHIKGSYFIYPADSRVKNSTVFFRALWERCLADDKIVICIFTMRLKSFPRLVALVPQQQSLNSDGEVFRYDGFRMEFIPYAGDCRDLSEVMTRIPEEDDDITAAMKKIVGRLRINFFSKMFDNPYVTKIYSMIEEQVFDEKIEDEMLKDSTMADVVVQDDRIDQFVGTLEELLNGFEDEVAPATKRKASAEPAASQRKKVSADDVNVEMVLKKCQEGNFKELSVAILRTYLELKDVKGIKSLTKPKLIEKILELN